MKTTGQIIDFQSMGSTATFSEDGEAEILTEYTSITIAVPIPFDSIPDMIDPSKHLKVTLEEK